MFFIDRNGQPKKLEATTLASRSSFIYICSALPPFHSSAGFPEEWNEWRLATHVALLSSAQVGASFCHHEIIDLAPQERGTECGNLDRSTRKPHYDKLAA